MKKFIALLLIIFVIALFFKIEKNKSLNKSPKEIIKVLPTPSINLKQKEKSFLFVPYWTLTKEKITTQYDEIIYFGISGNENGIDRNDEGYKEIKKFKKITSGDTLLTVRMTDSKVNSDVLENKKNQENIIDESIKIAKENQFKGIVLDFEISSLSFQSVIDKISFFFEKFYKSSKSNSLSFDITIYGDTFYRLRPYDVSFLGKNADRVLIMAYDFHKANGNPGPNFPLFGSKTYGYDLTKMSSDFINAVSMGKLGVIFGLFGYDWTLDEKGESTTSAKPLSFLKIKNNFLDNCILKNCLIKRDEQAGETKITYEDESGIRHIIWFEDMDSVQRKQQYLKDRGINTFAFWAYSYF